MDKIELGDEVKCKITEFKGVVTALSQCLTGCDRAGVRGPLTSDGKLGEEYWFDIPALKIIGKNKIKLESVQSKTKKGGPPTQVRSKQNPR